MTDLSTICEIPFCGKSEEWPIWIVKYLAKAKCQGFKDFVLGKLPILKSVNVFDEVSDEERGRLRLLSSK